METSVAAINQRSLPSDEEMLSYIERLSNWSRWGADDVLGTLNFITPDVRRRAVTYVRDGVSMSLGRDLLTTPPHPAKAADKFGPIQRFMLMTGQGLNDAGRVSPFAGERWSAC